MSLSYPVARSLEDALKPDVPTARSRREAITFARGLALEGLETSWLHLPDAEADALFKALGADGPAGHLQRYEDTLGHSVVAVAGEPLAAIVKRAADGDWRVQSDFGAKENEYICDCTSQAAPG